MDKSNSEKINEITRRGDYPFLRKLVTMLKNNSEQPPVLLEIQFLKELSLIDDVPLMPCQPRVIIESMMKIHAECTTAILKNPDYLTKLVYKYNSGENEEEYVFSNNMPFYIDVMTICFLSNMEMTQVDHFEPAMKDLIAIMRNKYHISDPRNVDPQIITGSKIAISFPTISLHALYYIDNEIKSPACKILRKWKLTNIFCLPWLALIIPVIKSEFKIPLALLLAIAVVLDSNNKPSYVLYQRILAFYTSEIFPLRLQLAICRHLGIIIYKEKNKYTFAPYFTKLRKKARKLISSIKVNDKSIKCTLCKI